MPDLRVMPSSGKIQIHPSVERMMFNKNQGSESFTYFMRKMILTLLHSYFGLAAGRSREVEKERQT
jgi:hypothetical protein